MGAYGGLWGHVGSFWHLRGTLGIYGVRRWKRSAGTPPSSRNFDHILVSYTKRVDLT